MRMAKKHKFVIRCVASPGEEREKVLVLTDFFVSYLCLLSSKLMFPEDIKQTQISIDRVFDLNKYLDRLREIMGIDLTGPPKIEQQLIPAYTTQIMEVFELKAGGNPGLSPAERERDANLDRMTILLNSVGNGLSLKRDTAAKSMYTKSPERCMHTLLLLALAANDPTALCTLGEPFRLSNKPGAPASWLNKPHYADVGSGGERGSDLPLMNSSIFKLDPDRRVSEYISLSCHFLGQPEKPPREYISTAEFIISKCKQLGMGGDFCGIGASSRKYETWRQETDTGPESVHRFTITVAALLWMDLKWVLATARKCGFTDPTVFGELKSDFMLYFEERFKLDHLKGTGWTNTEGGRNAVNGILRVAHWMIQWSTVHLERNERKNWAPMIFSRGWKQKVLAFAPIDSLNLCVVPTALLREEYGRLPRVWILETTGDKWMEKNYSKENPMRTFLRGKSVLFGNVGAEECEESVKGGEFVNTIKVHGNA